MLGTQRESITRDVNLAMSEVSQQLPNKPNLSSRSFGAGYIRELWKDPEDIKYVQHSVGHIRIESTGSYVESLPEDERQRRMLQIHNPKQLILRSQKKE
jgi:hypothetical protein